MKGSCKTAAFTALGATGLAVLYAFPPTQHHFYPRCPIYAATHLLCPGCGGTRALYELLHFNISGALQYNSLVTVLAPLALLWIAVSWYRAKCNGGKLHFTVPMPVLAALVLVAVLFTVARNLGMGWMS